MKEDEKSVFFKIIMFILRFAFLSNMFILSCLFTFCLLRMDLLNIGLRWLTSQSPFLQQSLDISVVWVCLEIFMVNKRFGQGCFGCRISAALEHCRMCFQSVRWVTRTAGWPFQPQRHGAVMLCSLCGKKKPWHWPSWAYVPPKSDCIPCGCDLRGFIK